MRSSSQPSSQGVRLRERGVQFTEERQEAGRGYGVLGSGRGEFFRSSHGEPVSAVPFGRVRGDFRASSEAGAGDEADPDGNAGDRRDEGAGECEQAQGDELWADEGRGRETKGGDRGVVAARAGG